VIRLVPLGSDAFVAGQISPFDIPEIAAAGVTSIVNNRPDGEEYGQPLDEDIRAAALAAGLAYRHIPVSGGFSPSQVQAMAEALDLAEGKLLAFCRAGTRSTWLWALAQAARGSDGETLIGQAAQAGYDITPLRALLR
jgi:uncharacterized protein (TIGR01244 family)